MEIEEAIDIIDKELHKKWDKKVEKKDEMTYIHLGDEEPLNEFEKASQRCLVEVQSLNREIERLNNIINSIDTRLIEMGVDDEMLDVCKMYDVNGIELRKMIKELKGSDKE